MEVGERVVHREVGGSHGIVIAYQNVREVVTVRWGYMDGKPVETTHPEEELRTVHPSEYPVTEEEQAERIKERAAELGTKAAQVA